jgi:parallel beta-helix repeat protein
MISAVFAFAAVLAMQSGDGTPSAIGQAPAESFGARDVFAEFRLPPLEDRERDRLFVQARRLQVMKRAQVLGVGARSATEVWTEAEGTFRRARVMAEGGLAGGTPVVFSGTLASELNGVLAREDVTSVRVDSAELEMDAPIRMARSGVNLDLGRARLRMKDGVAPYMIRVEGVRGVRVSGGVLVAGPWGVLVSGSQQVTVLGMEMDGLSGGGVMVTGSEDVVVWGNRLRGLAAGGVMLHGKTLRAVVAENEMTAGLGPSNWHAGVVVTDRDADLAASPGRTVRANPEWVLDRPMVERLAIPEGNVVAYNRVAENRASGIYSDGGVRNVFVGNRIEDNAKEGLCLDNGSLGDVVAWNLVRGNGKRWGMTDAELKQDFVFGMGRLPDGSAPAKLPGISIDNAAYNQVMFNEIDRNFGGGVKMVRTGYYNLVGMNLLTDNNEGQNARFHFFGVEMGAARSDIPSTELDFTGSRGNEIFGNTIRGTHYAGIFFADGSDRNDVFDNSIFGATDWAMESVKVQRNITLNNLTNLKLRNISSGLDPRLLELGKGEMDGVKVPAGGVKH